MLENLLCDQVFVVSMKRSKERSFTLPTSILKLGIKSFEGRASKVIGPLVEISFHMSGQQGAAMGCELEHDFHQQPRCRHLLGCHWQEVVGPVL